MEGMLSYNEASNMYEDELIEFNLAIDRFIKINKPKN